jgi:hypothetical protein
MAEHLCTQVNESFSSRNVLRRGPGNNVNTDEVGRLARLAVQYCSVCPSLEPCLKSAPDISRGGEEIVLLGGQLFKNGAPAREDVQKVFVEEVGLWESHFSSSPATDT